MKGPTLRVPLTATRRTRALPRVHEFLDQSVREQVAFLAVDNLRQASDDRKQEKVLPRVAPFRPPKVLVPQHNF